MADYILLNFNLKAILAFLPELVLLNLALIFVTVRVFAPAFGIAWFDGSERLAQADLRFTKIARYTVAGLLFFYVFCGALCLIEDHSDRWSLLSDQFVFDWPLLLTRTGILAAFYVVLAASESYITLPVGRKFGYEFLLISLVAVTGSLLLASSFDFLSLYLALEMQALAFYVLAGYKTDSEFSAEAAIKYFIIGAFGSILLLLGISFIYGATGVTNFFQLGCFLAAAYSGFYSNASLVLGLFLFLAAILLKLGLAPLHFWLPDAYQGAPLPVTLLFSTVPKISFFFVLVRSLVVPGSCLVERWNFVNGSFDFLAVGFFSRYFASALLAAGLLSIFLGSVIGLGQQSIKRLFAYSSISNSGFIAISLSLLTLFSVQSAFVYLLVYILLSLNFFALLFAIRQKSGAGLFSLEGFSQINSPVLGLLLSLSFFSLAGIPPLLGFYSKFFVYLSLMDSQYYFLTFVIAILTIFSTFYYVRLVTLIFFLPSMRSIFSVFFSAASNTASYLARPAHLPILHLAIVLALVNVSFFVHFDYLIFLITKFCFLLF